jgi:hypothetical protein
LDDGRVLDVLGSAGIFCEQSSGQTQGAAYGLIIDSRWKVFISLIIDSRKVLRDSAWVLGLVEG